MMRLSFFLALVFIFGLGHTANAEDTVIRVPAEQLDVAIAEAKPVS